MLVQIEELAHRIEGPCRRAPDPNVGVPQDSDSEESEDEQWLYVQVRPQTNEEEKKELDRCELPATVSGQYFDIDARKRFDLWRLGHVEIWESMRREDPDACSRFGLRSIQRIEWASDKPLEVALVLKRQGQTHQVDLRFLDQQRALVFRSCLHELRTLVRQPRQTSVSSGGNRGFEGSPLSPPDLPSPGCLCNPADPACVRSPNNHDF